MKKFRDVCINCCLKKKKKTLKSIIIICFYIRPLYLRLTVYVTNMICINKPRF